MLSEFKKFIQQKNLFTANKRILLAVSGGVDSVVMTTLFKDAGYHFGIAHINFSLRGKESDGDEKFVEQLAKKLNVPFFTARFDTGKVAAGKKISIQMAARDLRYEWLEEIRKKNKFHRIAVAHHLQDVTETILINQLRGTGINGLHGMLPVNGNIIRPLLFALKEEIMAFAKNQRLKWREDSSNESDDYTRNLIRNKVLPVFKKINPSYEKTFAENAERFQEAGFIVNEYIESIKSALLIPSGKNEYSLPKMFFASYPAPATILFSLLKKFNFTTAVVHDIIRSVHADPGKIFLSETHQLVIDRSDMILSPIEIKKADTELHSYDDHVEIVNDDFNLKIYPLEMSQDLYDQILKNKNKNVAFADADHVQFPVTVRTWNKGDFFYPFGMKGKKKVSDFYSDLKLSLTQKEKTWLLTDTGKILWIMGYRTDNRIAISMKTKFCFRMEFSVV
jgi:tRNA(Ile)-lysidine synthase